MNPTILDADIAATPSLRIDLTQPAAAHFIGIGGSGMRALADLFKQRGWHVTGSDNSPEAIAELSSHFGNACVFTGHAPNHLAASTELVITSDAIADDNPERVAAEQLVLRCWRYAEVLGELTRDKTCLAIAGTHGKSTTTAMLASIFSAAEQPANVICGATPLDAVTGGIASDNNKDDTWIVEACEFRRNFLNLHPTCAVITGIEHDHFDCFANLSEMHDAYQQFTSQIRSGGKLIVNGNCQASLRLAKNIDIETETFSTNEINDATSADWSAREVSHDLGRYHFQLHYHNAPPGQNKQLGRVILQAPGRHNVANALAAAAVAYHHGIDPPAICRGLSEFRGLHRRQEIRGEQNGIALVDDYAHHPTEVAATLRTLRQMYPGRRLVCVFQPHQRLRTERLLDEFATSLCLADAVIVAEVFSARERTGKDNQTLSAALSEKIRRCGGRVWPCLPLSEIASQLKVDCQPGDVVVTMGAGNIGKIIDAAQHWI